MNEVSYALLVVSEIRDEWYKPPRTYHMKKDTFDFLSYQRWALGEIEAYITEHQDQHPIDSVEEFRYEMDCWAARTNSERVNYICNIACDVAIDVLDVLKGMV